MTKEQWCEVCGGPTLRSKWVPQQPADSPLCSACWYYYEEALAQHPYTLYELDEYLDELTEETEEAGVAALVGKLFDWHGQAAPLSLLASGLPVLMVTLHCERCKVNTLDVFVKSGLHNGAWPYVVDAAGQYQACLRDQEYVCEQCQQKRQ